MNKSLARTANAKEARRIDELKSAAAQHHQDEIGRAIALGFDDSAPVFARLLADEVITLREALERVEETIHQHECELC